MAKKRARKGGRYTPPKRLRPPETKHVRPPGRRDHRQRETEDSLRVLDRQAMVVLDLLYSGWQEHAPQELPTLVEVAAMNAVVPGRDAFRENGMDAHLDALLWCRSEVVGEDAEDAAEESAFLDRCTAGAGLPPALTGRDILAVAEHYGLLNRDATGRLVPPEVVPLVTDFDLLTPEQAEEFLAWRRDRVLYGLPDRILDEFERRESDEWRTTLGDLARLFGVDLDMSGQALTRLMSNPCVSLSPDPAGLADGDEITLAWVPLPENEDYFSRSGTTKTLVTPNPPPLYGTHP